VANLLAVDPGSTTPEHPVEWRHGWPFSFACRIGEPGDGSLASVVVAEVLERATSGGVPGRRFSRWYDGRYIAEFDWCALGFDLVCGVEVLIGVAFICERRLRERGSGFRLGAKSLLTTIVLVCVFSVLHASWRPGWTNVLAYAAMAVCWISAVLVMAIAVAHLTRAAWKRIAHGRRT
jgi:hypothetical protein